MTRKKRIIIGISGASGTTLGMKALQLLHENSEVETHFILSEAGALTAQLELDLKSAEITSLADHVHQSKNIGASIASGSFLTDGMLIAPCSIRTMSDIAYGNTSQLMSRAADVTLKENRLLVLMVRETPLHLGHLKTMTRLAEMGAIIAPPVPAFYARPHTVDDIVTHSVSRVLQLFGIEAGAHHEWKSEGH